ncbi:MAG: hypothetical protein EZS28_039500 [Streblomastix strix]|uniref:Protein kinase domain-containing protein n=1 Tax=Streblomastix strix TaxID=222440 RepID=A0A5J4U3L4_9EUKA|nr:MAG: hypothetical protein EZS28_039500 [Streblomastix strix]
MLTGVHPYAGRRVNDTIENITKGKMVVPFPDYINGELKEMLMNMLNVDADKRPTAQELLDTELMQFQSQIDKANEQKDKNIGNEQQNKRINELEAKIRQLEALYGKERQDKEKEKRRADQSDREKGIFIEIFKQNQMEFDQVLANISLTGSSHNDEVISQTEWIEMKNELEKQERGTFQQKEQIRKKKIEICQKIIAYLLGKENDEYRKNAIEAGIIDVLLRLFNTLPLDSITQSHVWAFFVFTHPSSDEILLLLAEKKPYPALLRLLDHSNFIVLRRAVTSISNILIGASNLTPVNQPHPHFQAVASCGGIEKLYSLFKKNEYEIITYFIAKCIGLLFKAKEIANVEMRNDIISHLKSIYNDSNSPNKYFAKSPLKRLAENSINRAEIEKDGFKIPE